MQKRSRKKKVDLNELATMVVGQAITYQPPEESKPDDSGKNQAAVELGRLGGLKVGKARWKGVSKKKRSEAARRAATVRWQKKANENSSSSK
jgi:hypothetical protein